MSLYGLLYARVNGGLLVENQEIDLTFESGAEQVRTIPKGLAGITPGIPVVMMKFKDAVPITGPEFNFIRAMVNSIPVEMEISLDSGATMLCPETWVIGPVTLSAAAGKSTEHGVTLVANIPEDVFEQFA